ncbi:MAG: hypothetical protein KF745_08560 [Phycisphaeraceae bacterium]|nr:hypothetical protein [Phycisphaeraceae bacterium]
MTIRGVRAGIIGGMAFAAGGCGLVGCNSSYTATLVNMTPQPLYAKIVQQHDDGSMPVKAEERLGPGDKKSIGPVRLPTGTAILTLDTLPNPRGPVFRELRPGTTVFNIRQKGDATGGPLEVQEIEVYP